MLVIALVLALLYFSLMQLVLVDSSRALNEAQRFRARIVALTLAENGVELAAKDMITQPAAAVRDDDFQGMMTGRLTRLGDTFIIKGRGETVGTMTQNAAVEIRGRIIGSSIQIDYAEHTQ